MILSDVIEELIEERNLDREQVVGIVREGMLLAFERKFPDITFQVRYNTKAGSIEVFAEKEVVSTPADRDVEISLRKARTMDPKVEIGDTFLEPFEEGVGRIEMMVAKQFIATRMRELEQRVVYDEFKPKEGTILNGMVHKKERAGFVVKIGDAMAFLPMSCTVPDEVLRVGYPVRALLKEVMLQARGDHQLILDRSSAEFVRRLLESEIPEIFEGVVEIRDIVRAPGYKTKVVLVSHESEIDPVGTCVGVGGVRIKPILKELGREKVDLIEYTDDIEAFVAAALKPAEIEKVFVDSAARRATVWLPLDQRSFAIGKQGQNISLVAQLTGLDVQLQERKVATLSAIADEVAAAQQEEATRLARDENASDRNAGDSEE